jgi:hypothetical protein
LRPRFQRFIPGRVGTAALSGSVPTQGGERLTARASPGFGFRPALLRRAVPVLLVLALLLSGTTAGTPQRAAPPSAAPIQPGDPRAAPIAGSSPTFDWNTRIFSLPGFDPLAGYFPTPIYRGTGYQVPTLSAVYLNALGIYYVNNNSELVELQLANSSVRTVSHVVPLYQTFVSYGTSLNGMIDNEFFIDSGYGEALFFGTTSSSGATYSIELVNLTTGALRMWNTSAPVDAANQQVQYVGNDTVIVMSSNCSIYAFNLASHLSWSAGRLGASFGSGSTCFEANNVYWIPQKGQLINVQAHGDSGDHVEQLDASYNHQGQVQFTSETTIAVDSGVTYNWVNGIAYNASSDRIAFTAGYWGAGTVYTYVLGYSGGLLTTYGESRYSVVNGGANSGGFLDIQRYVYTSDYLIGWGDGTSAATGGTQYLFDPWNGSTIIANLTINNGDFGNQGFEGQYAGSPNYLIDFNASATLNSPMYQVVYAYHGLFTAYPQIKEELTPESGPNRTLVTVRGSGFLPRAVFDYCWAPDASALGCPATLNFTTTATGAIPSGIAITRSGGSAWLAVSEGSAVANFTISTEFHGTTPALSLAPAEGPNRTRVAVAGLGLAPNTTYDYCWTPGPSPVGCPSTLAFNSTLIGAIPPGVSSTTPGAGMNWLSLSQGPMATNFIASVEFNLTLPLVSVAPGSGPNGTEVGLLANGLAPTTAYDYCWAPSAAPLGCPSADNFTSTPAGTLPGGLTATPSFADPWLALSQGSSSAQFIAAGEFHFTTAHLNATPSRAPVHALVVVSGSGFAPDTLYEVCFLGATGSACPSTAANFTTFPNGTIPPGVSLRAPTAGNAKIEVSQGPENPILSTPFTRSTPSIGLVVEDGPSNAVTTVKGSGFSALGAIGVWVGGVAVPSFTNCSVGNSTDASVSANATGTFSCTFHVPGAATAGALAVTAIDGDSGAMANSSFRETVPDLTLSSVAGPPGTEVYVNGTGFDEGGSVTLALGYLSIGSIGACALGDRSGGTIVASAQGAFSCSVTIPTDAPVGNATLVATSSPSGAYASAPFAVQSAAIAPNGSSTSGWLIPLIAVLAVAAAVIAGLLLLRRRGRGPAAEGSEPFVPDEPAAEEGASAPVEETPPGDAYPGDVDGSPPRL